MTEEAAKSHGLQTSLHGDVYQIKLLMLYMHRSLKCGYAFDLTSEDERVEKLDDIVLIYNTGDEGVKTHRFLQAKHKQDESNKITYKMLLNDGSGEFSLKKYFKAYRNLKKKFKIGNREVAKEIVICTNIDFDTDAQHVVKEINISDPLMDMPALSLEKRGKYCKFNIARHDDLYFALSSSTDSNALAIEVAKVINKNLQLNRRKGLIKTYHKWIVNNVIDERTRTIKTDIADTPFSRELLRRVKDRNTKINLPSNFFDTTSGNYTKLTDTEIKPEEISDFLENLVFAVNQPDEETLGGIITNEIGERFNLLQAGVVSDIFFRKMLDWMKSKFSKKHTRETSNKLFDDIKEEIEHLMNANIDLLFRSKLKACSVDFAKKNEELCEFLNDKETKLLYFICQETLLGSLEVYYNIEKPDSPYKPENSKILLDMDQASSVPSIIKIIENLFQKDVVYNLLIIKCRTCIKEDALMIRNLVRHLKNVDSKKIILIMTQDIKFQIQENKVIRSQINFNAFAKKTQTVLKKRKINFQGSNKPLPELVEPEHLAKIEGKFLVSLILDEEIIIGNKLNEVDPSYIARKFNQRIEIKKSILKESTNTSDVILISGLEDISESDITNPKIELVEDTELDKDSLDKEKISKHWLKFKNDKIIWYHSNCSVGPLIPFRTETTLLKKEDDLLNEKLCVISDIAGMGKSTVLTKLAIKIKSLKNKICWVATIDLNSCQTVLRENMTREFNQNMIKCFLTDSLLNLGRTYSFEKYLFLKSLESDSPRLQISLFIDGFDEICPEYENVVIKLLQGLQRLNIANIFVTTRIHLKEVLETRLGVFSYTLVPFATTDQKAYLQNFFESKLEYGVDERLKKYVSCLITKMSYSINSREMQFIGVPLHIKMVAEIFAKNTEEENDWETCEEFLINHSEEPRLPKSLGFIKLYSLFYHRKEDNYLIEKSKDKNDSINTTAALNGMLKQLFQYQKKLSLKLFFSEEEINDLQGQPEDICEEWQSQLPKIGFVIRSGSNQDKPEFTHRTYAEYFVSLFFIDLLKKPNDKIERVLFTKVFLNLEFKVIRAFLNSYMTSNPLEGTKERSYLALLWEEDPGLICNENGLSVLHIAAEEGNINLIDFILNDLDTNKEIQTKLKEYRDKEERTALHSAVKSGCLDTIKKLYDPDMQENDKYGRSLLYFAAFGRHWEVVKWLLGKIKLERKDINVRRAFHFALTSGELDVVNLFLSKNIFDWSYLKSSGELLNIIQNGELRVLKSILKNDNYCIENDNDCENLLYAAFEYGAPNIVAYLLNSCKQKFLSTCTYIAAEFDQIHLLSPETKVNQI